jgi:hypothetical protein
MSSVVHEYGKVIETVESAYEYMLAYAAQGRDADQDVPGGSQIRNTLRSLAAALSALDGEIESPELPPEFSEFCITLRGDAEAAGRAVALVVAQPRISSLLVDNLNATIHLRAVLTDLFLLDEALKCRPE